MMFGSSHRKGLLLFRFVYCLINEELSKPGSCFFCNPKN